ncbi:hypothetical protein V492_08027 [Pseudogymnoascus sp. VKM F-4246]|nr:hypothetical protein V492_08027 [Pseudogymnoascus sp. VKM F-4246]
MQHNPLSQLPPQLRQPPSHLLKAPCIRDAVADNTRIRAAIVQARDRPKPFLPSGVPELQAHERVGVGVVDAFG